MKDQLTDFNKEKECNDIVLLNRNTVHRMLFEKIPDPVQNAQSSSLILSCIRRASIIYLSATIRVRFRVSSSR